VTELSSKDIDQLKELGISRDSLESQLKLFMLGVKPIKLQAAATINQGIVGIKPDWLNYYEEFFASQIKETQVIRFVPASGAASRMFKAFYQYLEHGEENSEIKSFADGYQALAFYDDIKCKNEPDYSCAINNMINTLRFAELPKAIIPFHQYNDGSRTALEEHLVEAALVAGKEKKNVNIHFTISQAHQSKFDELIRARIAKYQSAFNCNYKVTFSYQSHATDTVAVTPNNQIFRNTAGEMVFRPGGHGSLLNNLNELDFELIFIKNIDNIQPDHLKTGTVRYKKILGGYLISIQKKIAKILTKLDNKTIDFTDIVDFAVKELFIKIPASFDTFSTDEKLKYLHKKLNRPIRVCGMVKNEGEPGGGPFWVSNSQGEVSLQIVESSQINLADDSQLAIFSKATHFNPVDLVCWVKDYQGRKFNLAEFSDSDTAFITEKSQNGKPIKVLEHPGLWNGAMADWLTIFIEVPITTFSPVKTITDLLRKEHQPQ
jgi:uncharacterized protein DUF4301